ncbi:succinate dehydrogenase [uncultured Thioclava sp.]|uniref:succinate dehydrogenase n=1 Tax=uncultured Thioclava sp. TaxID=473858 RepID=UPI0025F6546D|nr:succinate dehydrogenase [uncultured Thioclava sp.]
MRSLAFLVALTGLCACQMSAPLQQSAEEVARGQAKTVVNTVVESKMPGLNAAPVTDCIIDNASMNEVFTIAKATVTGIDDSTVSTVMDVAKRPDTVTCIAKNKLGLN